MLAGLARFADELDWGSVKAWMYLGGLTAALIGAVAVYAAFETGKERPGMEQRLSLVTLGVRDLDRARRFYEALGWRGVPDEEVVFFQAGGMIVALWGRDQLAEDSVMEDNGGWGGVTLAYNTRSPAEVDAVIEEARAAGATIGREPATTFWGGYSGVFIDPEGHPWEVAHNPGWTIADDGSVRL